MPPPVQPEPWVAKPVRLYLVFEVEPDEELLLLELEEELELDEDELEELEDEELEELDEEELEEELLDEPDEAGVTTATERASWLELDAVQEHVAVPVAVVARVEPPPPLLEVETPQRLVWLEPGVRVELLAPLQATSTSQEPAVPTVALAEIVVPEVAVAVVAVGVLCVAPLSETEPALTPLAAPPKVTETVAVPEAGLSR
jgi:hypothetical protein